MGFFSKLFGKDENVEKPERKNIDSDIIDQMQKNSASESYKNKVYDLFYKSFDEKPFISEDREKNTEWIEQAKLFPKQCIIPISIMTRFSDGLLPGHVYMLYWLKKKNTSTRIPSYFEYKYGIDFETEKYFLENNGYLKKDKPTEKGNLAIASHYEIIENHSPKATSAKKAEDKYSQTDYIFFEQEKKDHQFTISQIYSISERSLIRVDEIDRNIILSDLNLLNYFLEDIRKKLSIRTQIRISIEEIIFEENFKGNLFTYFEYAPQTKSGRKSKYPFTLYFVCKNHYNGFPKIDCFGNIGYLNDGRMGTADVHYWRSSKGHHVYLGLVDDKLTLKKIECSFEGKNETIYKKR